MDEDLDQDRCRSNKAVLCPAFPGGHVTGLWLNEGVPGKASTFLIEGQTWCSSHTLPALNLSVLPAAVISLSYVWEKDLDISKTPNQC